MGNIGNYSVSLDEKGRLMVPKTFRITLGNDLIISLEFEQTLVLRPKSEFEKWSELLLKNNYLNKDTRLIQRRILGNSNEITFDTKGRILIPKSLLEQSKIKDTAYVVGTGDKVEIISSEYWKEIMSGNDMSLEEAAEKLSKSDNKSKEE